MPTYEYICRGCDHEFEQFQSMKDRSLRKCPKCGKNALERKIGTGGAVIFKGSGFYQTDYRSESYKKAADAEKKPASDGKAETPKSDAKTETAKSGEGGKAAETKKAAPAEGGSKRASGKQAKT
jgi:putative FmdB family regulatory protein